jgi:hypothetical protein
MISLMMCVGRARITQRMVVQEFAIALFHISTGIVRQSSPTGHSE